MVTPELIAFITSQLTSQVSEETITQTLIAQGWKKSVIQDGFQKAGYTPKQIEQIIITSGSISSLLQATLQVLKRRWRPLIGLSILTLIIVALATVLPGPLIALLFEYLVKTHPQWYVYVFGGLGYVLFIIISGTLQSWGPLAMIYLILHRNERISSWRTLIRTRRQISRFWSLWLLTSLSGLGAFVVCLVPAVLIFIAMRPSICSTCAIHAPSLNGLSLIFLIGGSIIGSIFAAIVTVWSMFSAQTMVDGDLKPLDAMVRSKQLITGNIRFILLRMSVIVGISLIFSPFISLLEFAAKKNVIFSLVIPIFLGFILVIGALIYMTLLYEHMRDHKTLPSTHKTRIKVGFAILSVLGVILPTALCIFLVITFSPFLSGFLQSTLSKELQKSPSLPSPLPSYLQTNYPGVDLNTGSSSAVPDISQ